MACDCDHYIKCKDQYFELDAHSDSESYSHTVSVSTTTNEPFGVTSSTTRSFSCDYGWDRDISPGYAVAGCEYLVGCEGGPASAVPHAVVSESCQREVNIPYYIDRQRGIYVWKHHVETLSFNISSGGKTAAFREKWGTGYFHKIIIPTSVVTHGTEQFILQNGGERSVLAEVSYTYKPFPATGATGAWGLYGAKQFRDVQPDTADVACILIFPLVPKQATAMDNDVCFYGFYDYNTTEAGMMESGLPHDDGGKDYFYPYWCRCMPTDSIWRATADQRYEVIYDSGRTNLAGSSAWTPPTPDVYSMPFGSFAVDSKDAFIASCLLQFSDRANSKGVVYNRSSLGDLYAAIFDKNKITRNAYTAIYPVTPI